MVIIEKLNTPHDTIYSLQDVDEILGSSLEKLNYYYHEKELTESNLKDIESVLKTMVEVVISREKGEA